MNKEIIEALEEIVKEYNAILYSKEYRVGAKLLEFKSLIKRGKIFTILKKIIIHNKIKKYENGEPIKYNIQNIPVLDKKIVIYTCITGDYDRVREPLLKVPNCDYILFTDNVNLKSEKWNVQVIPKEIMEQYKNNGTLLNRYYKLNPFLLFKEYDYAIYVDGSVQIVSDLSTLVHSIGPLGIALHKHRFRHCIYDEFEACKILKKGNQKHLQEQIEQYKKEGFPKKYGMAECGVIVLDLHNKMAKEIFNDWFLELLNTSSLRDQISLPFVLWKKNIQVEQITTLGNNIFQNPKIIIHKNHTK